MFIHLHEFCFKIYETLVCYPTSTILAIDNFDYIGLYFLHFLQKNTIPTMKLDVEFQEQYLATPNANHYHWCILL